MLKFMLYFDLVMVGVVVVLLVCKMVIRKRSIKRKYKRDVNDE